MNGRFLAGLIVSFLALAAAGAQAQAPADRGWYVGFAAGQSTIDFGGSVPTGGATASTVTQDDTDTAYKIFGGYRFNRHLALEAGYTDFGNFAATRQITAPVTGSVNSKVKSNGVHFDVLGIIPVGERFELFGRLGLIRTATTTDVSATGAAVLTVPAHSKDYNVSPRVGAGAQLSISRALGLRIEFERQYIDFQYLRESAYIGLVSAALVVRF